MTFKQVGEKVDGHAQGEGPGRVSPRTSAGIVRLRRLQPHRSAWPRTT
ncbi:MAG: hypothetical protein M0C28_39865 [Candidatus Moduliflexus flocculans]|nr:hypothetical protein [Candidatus Moduliflexus flocculans]